ncbi:hypothetical protein T05_13605 [Trichinella murrelli]|uniref:Uncharacterized protein n=1 Tax=Trichinella murrelli TaxID=144512 RepID=A0A0V0TGX8_9BILA|nr:hypothetical protein T05_13605 [Trichinella murrelli]
MERETFVAEQTTAHQHWSKNVVSLKCLSADIRYRVRCGDTGISAVVVFLCDACFTSFTDYILGISYTNQLHLCLIQCRCVDRKEFLVAIFVVPQIDIITISSYRADFIISANGFSSTRTNSRAGHCKTTLAYDEPPNRWRYPSLSTWTGVVTTEWFPVGSHGCHQIQLSSFLFPSSERLIMERGNVCCSTNNGTPTPIKTMRTLNLAHTP